MAQRTGFVASRKNSLLSVCSLWRLAARQCLLIQTLTLWQKPQFSRCCILQLFLTSSTSYTLDHLGLFQVCHSSFLQEDGVLPWHLSGNAVKGHVLEKVACGRSKRVLGPGLPEFSGRVRASLPHGVLISSRISVKRRKKAAFSNHFLI